MTPLPVGSTIGILGGGQLGRMLSEAAARMGFDVWILCPEADCPAARVSANHIVADYSDEAALRQLAESCDVITYEFENVPVASVQRLEHFGACVRPGAKSLEVSQDRLVEKHFLTDCGIQTAAFAQIDNPGAVSVPLKQFGGLGILKTRRDGYDGKGQVRVAADDDMDAACKALGNAPAILEALVPFELEISVVIARTPDGDTSCFESSRNEHVNGILRRSVVPAGIDPEIVARAQQSARDLADALGHIGVLALEFFVLPDGELRANEFAPRVHNSGHWTPEACHTGQFEQHIRAVTGWPLAPVTRYHNAEMSNLLGEEALLRPGEQTDGTIITLYGKRQALAGRKMGHVVRLVGLAESKPAVSNE